MKSWLVSLLVSLRKWLSIAMHARKGMRCPVAEEDGYYKYRPL